MAKSKFDLVMDDIRKKFGENSVMKMDDPFVSNVEVIPTGSYLLNDAIGVGGIPKGKITEIYGSPSAGKSSLALSVVANVQKNGGKVIYIDTENALNTSRAMDFEVDVGSLVISQPGTAEEAWNIAEAFIRSGEVDLVVVDSVAAMPPSAEIQNEFGASNMGVAARLNSQAMRKLTAALNQTKTALLLINQTRKNIGVMYGPANTTSGGEAIKFYASLRIELSRIGAQEEGKPTHHKAKIVKNKLAPPFRVVEFDIGADGIDSYGEIVDLAVKKEVIKKSGAWFSYNGENVSQGRDNLIAKFKEDPDFFEEIKAQVLTQKEEEPSKTKEDSWG